MSLIFRATPHASRLSVAVAAVLSLPLTARAADPVVLPDGIRATALSPDNRVYWRAGQGAAVDFALPGVGLPLAQPDGSLRARSGTLAGAGDGIGQ